MKNTWENNNKLYEYNKYNSIFRDKELANLYEGLKKFISADNLCDEIASSINKEELKEILNHISVIYGFN